MRLSPARAFIFVSVLGAALLLPETAFASDSSYYLTANPGQSAGQVTLTWIGKAGINNFHVVYGTQPGKYQYGALNVDGNVPAGKQFSFTVNYLNPETRYYFALSPVAGSKGLPYTTEASSFPKPGVVAPPPVQTAQKTSAVSPASANFQLSVVKGKKLGEAVLKWNSGAGNFQNYHVVYGTAPGKYQYGALNVGKNGEFKVGGLKPGEKYYFALAPVKDGKAQFITQEVGSVSVGGGGGSSSSQSSGSGGTSSAPAADVQTTGAGSGTTTTTTTNDNNAKNDANSGQNKKVKGINTESGLFGKFLDLLGF